MRSGIAGHTWQAQQACSVHSISMPAEFTTILRKHVLASLPAALLRG